MITNRFNKTVVIPTKVVSGKFQYFYGGPLPKLRDGTIFDLVVPEQAIEDKTFLGVIENSHFEELLSKDKTIYAAVSSSQVPTNLRDSAFSMGSLNLDPVIASFFNDARFVKIVLDEPLYLQLRGTKQGRLKPVKCTIPDLNEKAISLNHAYRLVSEAFEPQRISHVGNVFQKMLFIDSNKRCFLLDDLRSDFEAKYEHSLEPTRSQEAEGN